MLKVGITGGIGSGKTTVCRVFETLGIPVFYADDAARQLMTTDSELKTAIKDTFGAGAYENGILQRDYLARIVFNNPEQLQRLNALVHPVVIRYGREWMNRQATAYALKEAALFFESGTHTEMDKMVGVTAPESLRISRILRRDHTTADQIRKRMAMQMDEAEKMQRCDFVIINDDVHPVLPQVLQIHEALLSERGDS